tara:strand:+ start:4109 stop:4498 length:390 start_codon:yes stop_codon:yes gene_type:complete
MLEFKDFNIPDVESDQTEALSMQQRRARGRLMKRLQAKIQRGKAKSKMRTASPEVLKKRAMKQARRMIAKKFTKGVAMSELPPARRAEIEKRLDKIKPRIAKIAVRLIPKVRKLEKERKQNAKNKKDEE